MQIRSAAANAQTVARRAGRVNAAVGIATVRRIDGESARLYARSPMARNSSGRDVADELQLFSLVEDPARVEAAIRTEIENARENASARALLESIYCDEDRASAFNRFRGSFEFSVIVELLERLGVRRASRLCELGGGGGWLSWALSREGFSSVGLVEPNPHFVTGTGYLKTRADASAVRICNHLAEWYAEPDRYDLILTHNCVHHFRGLAQAAACIRQKIVPNGRWLMLREWFADTPSELYRQLKEHAYSQKYGLYEFPYPASYYVDSVEITGFKLECVVPARYANDALAAPAETEGGLTARAVTRAIDAVLAHAPSVTASAYRLEACARKQLRLRRFHLFTRPQALLFRRVPI